MSKPARSSNIPIPPGSHSQLVSGSVGITTSCSLLVFHCRSDIYVASTSRYIKLKTVLDYSLYVHQYSKQPPLVKLHGIIVHDVIMVHMISVDAQSHRCGNRKAIFGPAGHVQSTRPAGKNWGTDGPTSSNTHKHIVVPDL